MLFRSSKLVRRAVAGFVATVACGLLYATPATALEQFAQEDQAQQHCPKDTVVWLNLPTMIWHYKGQRWYGRTKHGTYVCQKEAAAAGARATRNGE
jgi:hypothetical protein